MMELKVIGQSADNTAESGCSSSGCGGSSDQSDELHPLSAVLSAD
jgi:hypothetical protein